MPPPKKGEVGYAEFRAAYNARRRRRREDPDYRARAYERRKAQKARRKELEKQHGKEG